MEKHITSPIYSIAVGDPITGMKWRVGQVVNLGKAGKGKITSIQEDEVHEKYHGVRSFVVIVDPEDADYYEGVWKRYEDMPVELTFGALERI